MTSVRTDIFRNYGLDDQWLNQPINWWTGKRLHCPAPTGLRAVIIRGLRGLIRLLERRDGRSFDTHSSMVVASPPPDHLAKSRGPSPRPT